MENMFQTPNQGSMSMLPSGNDCYIAIENGPVEIVDLPIDSMVIFRFLYVYQRVSRFETVENHHENWIAMENHHFETVEIIMVQVPLNTHGKSPW